MLCGMKMNNIRGEGGNDTQRGLGQTFYEISYRIKLCADGSRKLGLERKRFHERATTDEYEVRFLTSYNYKLNTNKFG